MRLHKFRDSKGAYTRQFYDSTGAFLVGELERLDPRIHEPLMEFTYHRDLPVRSDVTVGDEYTSFMWNELGGVGGPKSGGKNWFSKGGNVIGAAQIDLKKDVNPFPLWAMGVDYDLPELESAQQLGRSVDQMKIDAVQAKHQMDADELAYVGDSDLELTGLANSADVVVDMAADGAAGSPLWANKTPLEILADINGVLEAAWKKSGLAVPPSHLLLPPDAFAPLLSPISQAGEKSVMTYVKENNIFSMTTMREFKILPVKWLDDIGTEVGDIRTGRAVAYTPKENYVRLPITPLLRTNVQYDLLKVKFAYYGRMGGVEVVYPQTIHYLDGITQNAA
ncbi:MAG: DUF2184 domain-containing protein [Synergistaceae bacterium]|jgi:hypothetical protein|nr:DUF2184 domain-containing protein [Synergistaceae bacterium]